MQPVDLVHAIQAHQSTRPCSLDVPERLYAAADRPRMRQVSKLHRSHPRQTTLVWLESLLSLLVLTHSHTILTLVRYPAIHFAPVELDLGLPPVIR